MQNVRLAPPGWRAGRIFRWLGIFGTLVANFRNSA
jgi:hypothetical protein